MRIEKLHIKNFKVFADAEIKGLSNMCVFLGASGSGKSTLFDVFGFLSACLKNNVRSAINNRGGQVFISSHSPDFVNALEIDELFWLKKMVIQRFIAPKTATLLRTYFGKAINSGGFGTKAT